MKTHYPKFEAAVLNDEAREMYAGLYGDAGETFVDILNSSPDEIAVISRLLACLAKKMKGVAENGYSENSQGNRPV